MKSPVSHWLSALVLVVMPLAYWDAPLDPMLLPSFCLLAFGLLLLLGLLLTAMWRREIEINLSGWRKPVCVVYGAYVALVGLSLIQAINLSEAVFELARVFVAGAVLLIQLLSTPPSTDDLKRLAAYAGGICLVLAVIGFSQLCGLFPEYFIQHGVPAGTFANRGIFISYLCLLVPFSMLGSQLFNRAGRYFATIITVATLVLILLSENRSSWISLAVAGFAVAFMLVRHRKIDTVRALVARLRLQKVKIGVGILLVLAASTWLGLSDRGAAIADRAMTTLSDRDGSGTERLTIWRKTAAMAGDNLITGVGAGNCKIVFPSYGIAGTQQESGDIFFQRPHNDFLWIFSEVGIFGLLAYLAFFGIALRIAIRLYDRASDKAGSQFAVAVVFALTCFLVDSLFSFPKERITHLSLIMLITGFVSNLGSKGSATVSSRGRAIAIGGLVVMIAAAAVLLALGWIRLQSEIDTKSALLAREQSDWKQVITDIGCARSRFADLDPTGTPLAWYSGVAHFSLGDTTAAKADFEQAYADNPNHIHVLNNLATCAELTADRELAIALYKRLLGIHPGFLEARLNLAAVQYNAGNYLDAAETLAPIDSNSVDSKFRLYRARIAEKIGEDAARLHSPN